MKKIIKLLTISLYIIICFIACNISIVNAETTEYSDVLDDLRKDETFNIEKYSSYTFVEIKELNEDLDPTNDIPFMDVISLAESSSKELYIYVYNPTKAQLNIVASEISMYCEYVSNPKEYHPQLYSLELVSNYSVFDKYVVKDFKVSDEENRYYNLIEISRPFNDLIDTSIDNGSTDYIGIPVGKQWHCYYYNDELIYDSGTFKTLEIEVTLNDHIFYENGFTWGSLIEWKDKCSSHFIAFNVDEYIIKKIYDADLTFKYRKVEEKDSLWDNEGQDNFEIGSLGYIEYPDGETFKDETVYLSSTDKVTFEGKGLWAKTFNWNRIYKASKFIENYESQGGKLINSSKEKLLESQWVFCFKETNYTSNLYHETTLGQSMPSYYMKYYTEVAEVDILRISFLDINNKYYNLGVVGDKTTADNIAGGSASGIDFDEMSEWFEKIMMIVGLIGLLVLLGFCPSILNIIIQVFKFILNVIITILTLPIKFFKWLFNDKKKPKNRL